MKERIISWFFPNKCPCCHKIIEPEKLFCDECPQNFSLSNVNRCKVCFSEKALCNCRKEPKFYSRSLALFDYKGAIVNAIITMKKRYNKRLCRYFAAKLAQEISAEYCDTKFDAVIAVPMHKSKIKKRGFNQSEVLAKELASILNLPFENNVLSRHEKALEQHSLSYKQRKENVKNIYRANGLDYDYRNILLVDDIMTTGFTLNECAKMLVLDGAQKVYCVSIAKA